MLWCSAFRLSPMTPPRDNYTVTAPHRVEMDVCLKSDSDVKTDDTTHSPREYENIYYAHNEIKRRLLLGRKVMTNLDSIFKTRDITLPTKVRLVKAMVFPVVMCGYESWTVKKAER